MSSSVPSSEDGVFSSIYHHRQGPSVTLVMITVSYRKDASVIISIFVIIIITIFRRRTPSLPTSGEQQQQQPLLTTATFADHLHRFYILISGDLTEQFSSASFYLQHWHATEGSFLHRHEKQMTRRRRRRKRSRRRRRRRRRRRKRRRNRRRRRRRSTQEE